MVASRETRFYPALMLWLLRSIIRVYQCTISPLLGLLCGPDSGCRFMPTCSAYFLEAVETHGVARGSWLGLKRLERCQPWGGAGGAPFPQPLRHVCLFVNNRFCMIFYGSNCVDCRYSLRDWARPVGALSGKTDAAETCAGQYYAGAGRSYGNPEGFWGFST